MEETFNTVGTVDDAIANIDDILHFIASDFESAGFIVTNFPLLVAAIAISIVRYVNGFMLTGGRES